MDFYPVKRPHLSSSKDVSDEQINFRFLECECCKESKVVAIVNEDQTVIVVKEGVGIKHKGKSIFICKNCYEHGMIECKICRFPLRPVQGLYHPKVNRPCECGSRKISGRKLKF